MNKNNFINALKRPASPQENLVENMQFFVDQYPYCQSAQILLAKALNNTSEIGFEKQLRIAAAYAADRQHLHQLIFTKIDREVDIVKPKEALAFNFDYEANKEEQEVISTKEEIEQEIEIVEELDKKSAEPATQNNFLKFEIDKLNQKTNSGKKSSDENSAAENDSLEIDLEKQIITEAIYSSFSIEANEKEHKEAKADESIEPIKKNPNPLAIGFNENPHSFSDWLNHIDEDIEESEILDSKAEKTQIIEQFIEKNPQITTKKEFYSPVNMARLSVKENDDLVTETLAKIYAQQGKIDKAISAYEKLALKYPEKRIYFANQINKLGGNLNK